MSAVTETSPDERPTVGEWSIVPSVLGVSPWVAVGAAAAATLAGVAVDLLRAGTLGAPFVVLYVAGCVLAVAWVRRDGLFGPMVAPPLLLAVTVPVVALLFGSGRPGAGIAQKLLTVGAPLVNAFPTMAWTTAGVLALGIFRLVTQRTRRPDPGVRRRPAEGEERAVDRVKARSAQKESGKKDSTGKGSSS